MVENQSRKSQEFMPEILPNQPQEAKFCFTVLAHFHKFPRDCYYSNSHSSYCCGKIPNESPLEKEKFASAHSLMDSAPWQGGTAAGA